MSPEERTTATGRRPRRTTLLSVCGALTGLALTVVPLSTAQSASAATTSSQGKGTRVSAWSPSMTTGGPSFTDRTIRMVVHSSVAGSVARITLSNRYSTTPLEVGTADVAVRASGGEATRGTTRNITFGGFRHVTIAAGEEAVSDVVPISVSAGENLLVSLYVPGTTGMSTWHSDAFDTTYIASGNHTGDDGAAAFGTTTTSWYYLAGLDVVSPTARGAVVAFGDSITDGYHSSTGTYSRWPDFLGRRLGAGPGPQRLSVVDAGIGGNRVLTDVPNLWQGVSALKRFGYDALGQPGVRDVILFEGINDIGNDAGPDGRPLTAQDLIDGYRTLIDEAHAAHVRVIGATLMPDQGNGYYTPAAEDIRQSVNQWIRTSGAFDGVIDFDKTMRDPANPAALDPAYDSGDHLHPDDEGMKAMADAVDLRLLRT
ncbi:lysophospholipase L1-like esterase [Streptomyces puniciscabiei]|uniref:Lysophospholipase L1-like esterase n=1 Tax=Streptomyces puniciscabiei TaxID=164348 RepID=A0A542THV8_9ACTN|nr:SGNH/GDSL hydrolase family protein [Streptomyces puniciscabiei]TQK86424.1 lysophospholipase L1-like esterase [Streptomyces puniciscabiei]